MVEFKKYSLRIRRLIKIILFYVACICKIVQDMNKIVGYEINYVGWNEGRMEFISAQLWTLS